jgi:cation transport regulator ChaC
MASTSGSCRGIAFEFPADRASDVRAYLDRREGTGFTFHLLSLRLDDGTGVDALVPIYQGKNILAVKDMTKLVAMIGSAKGREGSGVEYVRGVASELARAGIDDPMVTVVAQHFPG